MDQPTTPALQQLHEAVDGMRVAMLTTISEAGLLTSKPMHLLEQDAQGQLWFYCMAPDPLDDSFNPYQRANLAFSDESASRYVSVACHGELVRDRARIHALWSSMAKPWFPDGPDSPDLACLKLVPLAAELWDGPGNGLAQALAIAASVIAGKPVGMGGHVVLDKLRPDAVEPASTP
jgi:general stress protein 26